MKEHIKRIVLAILSVCIAKDTEVSKNYDAGVGGRDYRTGFVAAS